MSDPIGHIVTTHSGAVLAVAGHDPTLSPGDLRRAVLYSAVLEWTHPGQVFARSLARSGVYPPGMRDATVRPVTDASDPEWAVCMEGGGDE